MKHLIFAGTIEEAQTHARESGLDHGQWAYADARNKVEGLRPENAVTHLVGSWEYNSDVVWTYRFWQDRCRQYGFEV